ncbi:MAG: hypothetical protein INH41_30435, partial [Myxococcaceae bacterium]|nr:hypothetical protein [Myxococcaceae bacterium]
MPQHAKLRLAERLHPADDLAQRSLALGPERGLARVEQHLGRELELVRRAHHTDGVDVGPGVPASAPLSVDVGEAEEAEEGVFGHLAGQVDLTRPSFDAAELDEGLPVDRQLDDGRLDVGPLLEDVEVASGQVDDDVVGELERHRTTAAQRQRLLVGQAERL